VRETVGNAFAVVSRTLENSSSSRCCEQFCSVLVPNGGNTFPTDIDNGGGITGHYNDTNGLTRGFLRSKGGGIKEFDVPGAGNQINESLGINNDKSITGGYEDANSVFHGFVRTP
jgi:hypothetical protein